LITMQRVRIKFTRGDEVKYISHLDVMRLWQRAFVRAGVDLAYSEGFNPHPKMSLAAPLALGVTSEAELMDITLSRWTSPPAFRAAVERQLPPGVRIREVLAVAPTLPSLQSQVRLAEYSVTVATGQSPEAVQAAIDALLAKETLPWQHRRDTGPRQYDLRALVNDLWAGERRAGAQEIGMLLRCDSQGSGRPEQVAAALGFEGYPLAIHRTRLILEAK
jgi:radical SAM-linked protein